MQSIASEKNHFLSPAEAERGKNYLCPECGGILRLRKGGKRLPHFYHLRASKTCHLAAKSETHLAIQEHLATLLKDEQPILEHPFPEIGRIADVACLRSKKIFEVQCSPISLREAQSRCSGYEALGYTVIWILHEKSFNKRRSTSAEKFLRSRGAYYTNFHPQHSGEIYDQLARRRRPIDLTRFQLASGPWTFRHSGDFHPREPLSKSSLSLSRKVLNTYHYLLTKLLTPTP